MPRDISTNEQSKIVQTITTPYYLIDLLLNTPLYYSTKHAVTCNSHSYQTDRRISVGALKHSPNGAISSSINISNIDNAMSTVFLLGNNDINVIIRATYEDGPIVDLEDTSLLFSGSTNGFKIGKGIITLSILSKDLIKFSPGIIISNRDFSYLPAKGTEIRSGNVIIILK